MHALLRYAAFSGVVGLNIMLILTFIARWIGGFPTLFPPSASSETSTFQPVLRLNKQNEFSITIFSDLHYGEEEDGWGVDQDINSTRVMNKVLDVETPDIVVLNGDLITRENTFLENSTAYVDIIVQPLVARSLPWASTYGNHDSQFNLSREALFQSESKYPLSYTRHSPSGVPGVTNYYLLLYPQGLSPSGDRTSPVAALWFFDSQGGALFQAPPESELVPDWVEPEVVSWFNSTLSELHEQYGIIPSLAFVHIPPTIFLDVQRNNLPKEGVEDGRFPGLNDDVPLATQGYGAQDSLFVQALGAAEGLHSVYSGHDHGDSWCTNWPGTKETEDPRSSKPHLCFCKHAGYGGYGNWNRGARNLRLTFWEGDGGSVGLDVETWVRMEDGEVVQKVVLNSTYGIDVYPIQDGEL